MFQARTSIIKEYLTLVLQTGATSKDRIFNFISLLAVLRGNLEGGDNENIHERTKHEERLSDLYQFQDQNLARHKVDNKDVVESLLVALKAFLRDLSFESWLELAEIPSFELLSLNGISGVWREGDTPSNLQFIAAHLLAQCKLLMQVYPGGMAAELLNIISGFSRLYSKELELNLDEMSRVDILDRIGDSEDQQNWKLDAFIDTLFGDRLIAEVLSDSESLSRLSSHPEKSSRHSARILAHLKKSKEVEEFHKQFLKKIARCLDFNALQSVAVEVTEDGFDFQTEEFDVEFVEALNKATEENSEEVQQDFLVLCIQNGRETVSRSVGV